MPLVIVNYQCLNSKIVCKISRIIICKKQTKDKTCIRLDEMMTKRKLKKNWTLDKTGTGQWKQTKQCVTEKKTQTVIRKLDTKIISSVLITPTYHPKK